MKMIVAVDRHWGIGRNGDLLFHLPDDMRHFKEKTTGCTVVMGDVTLFSLPGGRPLKNRRNIVLSFDPNLAVEGAEVCHSLTELAGLLSDQEETYVIGGASIYRTLMDCCDTAYVTRVDADGHADVCIPDMDALPYWEIAACSDPIENNGHSFRFYTYQNHQIKPLI